MSEKSFFGVPVVEQDGCKLVRVCDIQKLPFYEFWNESAIGSTIRRDESGDLVYLSDWEGFAALFIRTGRHRYQKV